MNSTETVVSVIMPCYNSEKYVEEALLSVINQKFVGKIEIIILDDFSQDNTIEVVRNFTKKNEKTNISYHVITSKENKGQGYQRNRGIAAATGKYILFLDSDDFLSPNLLLLSMEKMKDTMDFVMFDWAFYYPDSLQTVYVNKEKYNLENELRGKDCELLLSAQTYFSVNKLYKKEFIEKNDIKFGEGYLYEDFEFYTQTAQFANHIGILPEILYKVRVHEESSTKKRTDSLVHYESFLKAIDKTCSIKSFRGNLSTYNLYKYLILRCLIYAKNRIPNKIGLRTKFVKNAMKILNSHDDSYDIPKGLAALYYYAFTRGFLRNERARHMRFYYMLQDRNLLYTYKNSISEKFVNSILYLPKRIKNKRAEDKKRKRLKENIDEMKIIPGKVFMLGFDQKYMGNSKYLFDYLSNKFDCDMLKYATNDPKVPKNYRVNIFSTEFLTEFYTSEIIIGESWIPLKYDKKEGQKWIQLWHGTPFKKMLFDSTELSVMLKSPNHKVNLKKDVEKWDWLLSDSEIASEKFATAFDIDSKKVVALGYPRNQWLVKNNNRIKIEELKKKFRLPLNKKIILYAPTWRDYNFKKSSVDFDINYLMNIDKFQKFLNDDNYFVVFKGHDMEAGILSTYDNLVSFGEEADTQELVLIADILISDYSSIIFDGIQVKKPVYLFINDLSKYEFSRGVYEDMLHDFRDYIATDEEKLSYLVKTENVFCDKRYFNENVANSSENIQKLFF